MINNKLNVGIFGVGLEAYWTQFPGLLDKLIAHLGFIDNKLKEHDVSLINLGMIDNPEKAFKGGTDLRRSDVDIIFIYVATYTLSHSVLPIVQKTKVPVIILNLAPDEAIDYKSFNKLKDRSLMTGKWLEYCSACSVPEISNVFQRIGIHFYQITGHLKEDYVWEEIEAWIDAAKVKKIMSNNRVGLIGHYYNGMLDIYTDLTNQIAHFGNHFEIIEVDALSSLKNKVREDEIVKRVDLFNKRFDVQDDCSELELRRSARTSIAMDKLVEINNLGSIAYYFIGEGNKENEDTISSIILGNSLLTEMGIPVAGEYEVKNVQAMKIMDSFGVGGSFTEYYAIDFKDDIVLMGHDGPGHIKIAEGKTKVKPLEIFHGKSGKGLSVEMSVKHGSVTILSIAESKNGKLKFVYAHGESVAGPILEIGNTNSRYKFDGGARKFVERWNLSGAAHHCAVGLGHIGNRIEKLANLLNMEIEQIC